jgi:DNA-binding HxlR family transcriptional regulator
MAGLTRASRTTLDRNVRCPVATALDIVGDRWTLLIVRDLLRGTNRFSQLLQSVEGVTTSLLSDRLKLLEREGIIERRFYSEHPPRAEYVLTPKGHGLGVIVGALSTWGQQLAEHDLRLIDKECGHPVRVSYQCDECGSTVPRSRIRIVEADAT